MSGPRMFDRLELVSAFEAIGAAALANGTHGGKQRFLLRHIGSSGEGDGDAPRYGR